MFATTELAIENFDQVLDGFKRAVIGDAREDGRTSDFNLPLGNVRRPISVRVTFDIHMHAPNFRIRLREAGDFLHRERAFRFRQRAVATEFHFVGCKSDSIQVHATWTGERAFGWIGKSLKREYQRASVPAG